MPALTAQPRVNTLSTPDVAKAKAGPNADQNLGTVLLLIATIANSMLHNDMKPRPRITNHSGLTAILI